MQAETLAGLMGLAGAVVGAAVSTGAVTWQQRKTAHEAERVHLAGLQLRRDAAIRLVQMTRGGSRAAAARYLGITLGALQSATVTIRAWQKMPGNADAYQDALQHIVEIAAATEAPSSTKLTAPDEVTVEPRTRRCGDRLPPATEPGPGSTLGTPSAPSEE